MTSVRNKAVGTVISPLRSLWCYQEMFSTWKTEPKCSLSPREKLWGKDLLPLEDQNHLGASTPGAPAPAGFRTVLLKRGMPKTCQKNVGMMRPEQCGAGRHICAQCQEASPQEAKSSSHHSCRRPRRANRPRLEVAPVGTGVMDRMREVLWARKPSHLTFNGYHGWLFNRGRNGSFFCNRSLSQTSQGTQWGSG